MKLLAKVFVVGCVLATTIAQAEVQGTIEIPVHPGQAQLKPASKLSGGVYLNLQPAGAQSLSLKCHQGLNKVSLMVFLKGSILSEQLIGAVDTMDSCVEELQKLNADIQNGANTIRIEVHGDHTLVLSTLSRH
ncbi:MAG: hypothetical protein J7501_14755 [Bdellovibrio sp.]|nr:hypothetical protein [Bdellovibrio sp.]